MSSAVPEENCKDETEVPKEPVAQTSSTRKLPPLEPASSTASTALDFKAICFMFLLALQFGIQPILTRKYTPPVIARSTVILTQEVVKFFMALLMLQTSGARQSAFKVWSFSSWISVALFPAILYTIQNLTALLAYQNLDGFTFNVLNQTKTLSAALCCWLVINRRQTRVQIFALLLLLLAACVMERIVSLQSITSLMTSFGSARKLKKNDTNKTQWQTRHYTHGVLPIMIASFLSGLAGALSEKNLQGVQSRNSLLFSMELCAGTVLVLAISMLWSEDGKRILRNGFWFGWTYKTFIPILSNSAGGIIVGLVTKHAGAVRKGFALIFGILFSGIIQAFMMPDHIISQEHIVGGFLAVLSLYLHATHPPSKRVVKESLKQE